MENPAYCYRHLNENFTSFFNTQNIKEKKLKENVWNNIAYVILANDHNEVFAKHMHLNKLGGLWKTILNINGRCQSSLKNIGKITTNITKSFNGWLRKELH